MLVFECPSCKTKMQASEEHAGKTTVCPNCGTQSPIPSAAADAITADPGVVSTAAPKPDAITADPGAVSAPMPGSAKTSDEGRPSRKDRDDDFDDRDVRRRRDSSGVGTAAAVGMSVGMVVLISVAVGGCVLVGVVAILIALLVPAVQKVREAAARTQTMNNLKEVSLGFHAYHNDHKKLPSPKLFSQQGMKHVDLSWRVSILAYIDNPGMFQQIDQTNGWDQGRNTQFANQRPRQYDQLLRPEIAKTDTAFQYFTGPNTLFPDPQRSPRFTDITDGTSNTFQLAEAQTPVPWLKPADMVVAPNGDLPLPKDRFMALMADGSVRMIDRSRTNDVTLRMLIDPTDGGKMPPDF